MSMEIRQAAEAIVQRSTRVSIDDARLSALAASLRDIPVPACDTDIHYFDGSAKSVMYTLLLDAVNFCFWPSAFSVEYRGKTYGKEDGYCALAVALKRAFDAEVPLWDASFLANLGDETWATICRGQGRVPLMTERLSNARNVGAVLRDAYGGDPLRLIAAAGGSAAQLARLLATSFDAYKDDRIYRGLEFPVRKRAQICVSDLVGSFAGRRGLELSGADELTCFADYKLPQLFHDRGVFAYAPELEARILAKEVIPEGSEEEVEIRAATIVAVERMKAVLTGLGRPKSAREIDWLLWNESVFGPPLRFPHHRTITTAY
jgi:hypothetical protein